jgi:diguanylate cyclase (GGDEF)-like protein
MKPSLTIRGQLVVLVMAIALPMVGMLVYTIFDYAQQRVKEAQSTAHILTVAAVADVERVLSSNRDLLVQMAKRPLIRRMDAAMCDQVLWDFRGLFPKSANMTVIDLHGTAICSAVPQPNGKAVSVAQAAWFKQSLAQDDFVVSDPFFGPITRRWVTVLTYPIRDDVGRKIGFLGLPLDLALYEPNLSHAAVLPDTSVEIITAAGQFIWRNQDTEKWVGKSFGNHQVVQHLLADVKQTMVGVDGVRRFYDIHPIQGVNWYVFVGMPSEGVYAELNATLWRNGLLGLASVLLILGFAAWVARHISRPIGSLAVAARAVRQGRLTVRATLAGSPEIREVAQELNEMLDVRLQAEQGQKRMNRALKLLSACNVTLIHAQEEAKLLDEICRLVVDIGGYNMAWVGFAEQDADKTVRLMAQYGDESGYLKGMKVCWSDTPQGAGPTGSAIRTGRPSINQDYAKNPHLAAWREAAEMRGYRASIALPLIGKHRVLGALTMYSLETNVFSPEEVGLLEELANDLAFGIETLRTRLEHAAAEKQLAFLAHHDVLTGLPNRLLLREHFTQARLHAEQTQSGVAVLFLDLDNFKQINDTLGHNYGDQLLMRVVARLRDCLQVCQRDAHTLSRQGGDEFVILLYQTRDIGIIGSIARYLTEAFTEPFDLEHYTINTTFSIGISVYPNDGDNFDVLLKNADTALYQAKDSGRDTYRFFSEQMQRDAQAQLHLQGQLRHALKHQEFRLYYQPQIQLDTEAMIGVEALIRWQHPQRGLLAPSEFIVLAERTGLIVPIGEWVLNEACRQAQCWRARGHDLVMAVNLSSLQFKRGNLLDTVARALQQSGLPADQLELELTESILLQDVDGVIKTLHNLKEMGVKLSIDDFGTGYSSLSYLKRLAVNKLKIDQSFIHDLPQDPDSTAIVKAIIQLGHILQLTVIAEGVETQAQLTALRENSCDQVQGYFYSRPVTAEQFEQHLPS